MIALAIREALAVLGGRLRGALASAWGWATGSVVHGLVLVLALSAAGNVWLWRGWDGALADLAARVAAEGKAATAQVAANHEPAARSATIARASDDQASAIFEAGRRAGAAYADAHRVRDLCSAGAGSVPGTDRASAQHDGSGAAAELVSTGADWVAISRADFDTCTDVRERLGQVHDVAWALIGEKVAVPSTGPSSAPP